ncbi:NAD(P)-dependent oxidoreductase [Ectothiorhodospiraceae bacterium WFHF3C12]|nr:NAD(P)-dependent oxidoreductase [Ectothiorhodospiraceae bacterium WFHF3C12]
MKAGVIGLGAMGSGMAKNLARAGMLASIWNRTRQVAEDWAKELGVDAAADPAEVARACDVIITCVSRDEDVLEMMEALAPGLAEGKVVVDTSTVSVDTVNKAAEVVAAKGARLLDAPVSGGKEGAHNATMVMMVGGEREAFDRALPVLEAISKSQTYMGESGKGQATKAVNQIMAAGINQAVTEALAFGQTMGLDMDKVVDVVGGGAAGNWFVNHRGKTMTKGVYEPGFKLALHHKDLSICRQMLDKLDVALPVVEMTLKHYERLMEEGHGDEDISALYRAKRELFETGNKKSL